MMRFYRRDGSIKTRSLLGIGSFVAIILFFVGLLVGHYGIPYPDSGDCGESHFSAISGEQMRQRMFDEIKADNIREHLRNMTAVPHPAGSAANNAVVEYIKKSFQSFLGTENVNEASYNVLLSRPNSSHPNTVSVLDANGVKLFDLKNREEKTGNFDSAFFAYAQKGTVTSDILIYADQATEKNFAQLRAAGLDVNGSIVLARYGGFRGDQVEMSAKYGALAVLLFLDPSLVAPHGTNESLVYPKGAWMPPSAISRGSVFTGKGDPLSQGFASVAGRGSPEYRQSEKDAKFPHIPALPIGYGDAQKLFDIMDSQKALPAGWSPSPYLNYTIGGRLIDKKLTVTVTDYTERSVITNVIATIPGCVEPDRYVILGNHFDAWTSGGIDPNSGTATMLELARVMGVLKTRDAWCPRRTIIFGAWDAEEYGLIGSTEWIEENLQILQERAVAYINIDASVRGHVAFAAMAMPLLTDVIYAAAKVVDVPNNNSKLTLYDAWRKNNTTPFIGNVGAGSDYANFVNMIGVTSADLRYNAEVPNPAYHTAFETFEYVEKFVDPSFEYHVVITKVWGEIIRDLAESKILPFSVLPLANRMNVSWQRAKNELQNMTELQLDKQLDLDSLSASVQLFGENSKLLAENLVKFQTDGRMNNPIAVREMSDRLMKIERMFLEPNGLPNRPLERHVLQAPSTVNTYDSKSFAGVFDCTVFIQTAKKEGDKKKEEFWWNELKLHFTKIVQIVDRAARFLTEPTLALKQTLH